MADPGKIYEIMFTGQNVGRKFWQTLERIRVDLSERYEGREGILNQIGVKFPVAEWKEEYFRSWLRFLPPQGKKIKTFDIILHGEEGKFVVLRFTTHNLYLMAIGIVSEVKGRGGRNKGQKGEGKKKEGDKAEMGPIIKWFEFLPQSGEKRIIEDSTFLPITCNYQEHSDAKLKKINANPDQLVAIINELNSLSSGSHDLIGKICNYMPRFAFLISESLWFYKVAKFFALQLERTCASEGIGPEKLAIVRQWSRFSRILLHGVKGKYTLEEFVRAREELLLGLNV